MCLGPNLSALVLKVTLLKPQTSCPWLTELWLFEVSHLSFIRQSNNSEVALDTQQNTSTISLFFKCLCGWRDYYALEVLWRIGAWIFRVCLHLRGLKFWTLLQFCSAGNLWGCTSCELILFPDKLWTKICGLTTITATVVRSCMCLKWQCRCAGLNLRITTVGLKRSKRDVIDGLSALIQGVHWKLCPPPPKKKNYLKFLFFKEFFN